MKKTDYDKIMACVDKIKYHARSQGYEMGKTEEVTKVAISHNEALSAAINELHNILVKMD